MKVVVVKPPSEADRRVVCQFEDGRRFEIAVTGDVSKAEEMAILEQVRLGMLQRSKSRALQ